MDVIEAIKKRRSIRQFTDDPLPAASVQKIAEALIWAPSAGNLQSRRFYFIRDQGIKDRLAAAALRQSFIARAPLVVVGCADSRIHLRYGERGEDLYTIQDVSASIMSMMLLCEEEGLGTVWVGAFDENEAAFILNLPDHLRPVAIVPVGYPAHVPPAPTRLARDEVIIDL